MKTATTLRGSSVAGACARQAFARPAPALGIVTTAILAIFHGNALAQANPAAVLDRQSQIIESQQRDRLREDQERALRALPAPGGTNLDTIKPQVQVPDIGVACRDIREIEIKGDADRVPDYLRNDITRDYAGRCLAATDLEAILAALTKSFIDRGFITTRAYLPAQDLRTGKLEITVVTGRIERYEIEGGRSGAIWPHGAFPGNPGDLLNLRDLEQGIDQINSVASNNARLDLRPGSQAGQTVVAVQNASTFPVHLYGSYDNLGTEATGRNAASATVTLDSLLGLNELFAITRRQSVFPMNSGHKSDSTAVHAQLPYGYSTFTVDYSQSNYTNTLTLPSGATLKATGKTDTWSVGADRVMFRNQSSRVALSARLVTQESKNWLGGEFLQVSSRTLTFLDVGVNAFTQAYGGIFNGRLAMVQGLSLLGALHDSPDLPRDLPHAQFNKFTLDLGYNRRFDIGGTGLTFSTQFSGQAANDTLYGTQQILIGGPSSVRGFQNFTLAGDNGYYVRNELALPWQVSSEAAGTLAGRVYAGFDWGNVTNRAPGVPSGSLSGATLGVGLFWKTVAIDAFAARAVRAPSSQFREGTLFSLRLSASI